MAPVRQSEELMNKLLALKLQEGSVKAALKVRLPSYMRETSRKGQAPSC
jgi:hypothetical protein